MRDEALILQAIKSRETGGLSDVGVGSGKDAIGKLERAYARKDSWKKKACLQWNTADFIRYLDSSLRDFGVPRSFGNTRQDSYYIDSLYDMMVRFRGDRMNNEVMRDYMQWWCSIKAPRLTGSHFHLKYLMDKGMIKKFMSRYESGDIKFEEKEKKPIDLNDGSLYSLGGVSLLLIKRGLVISRSVCLQNGKTITESEQDIVKSLLSFSSQVIESVVRATQHNAPYDGSMKFDFVSLIRPILEKRGLVESIQLNNNESYFKC